MSNKKQYTNFHDFKKTMMLKNQDTYRPNFKTYKEFNDGIEDKKLTNELKIQEIIFYNTPFIQADNHGRTFKHNKNQNVKYYLEKFKIETWNTDEKINKLTYLAGSYTEFQLKITFDNEATYEDYNKLKSTNYIGVKWDMYKKGEDGYIYFFLDKIEETFNENTYEYNVKMDVIASYGFDLFTQLGYAAKFFMVQGHRDRHLPTPIEGVYKTNDNHPMMIKTSYKTGDIHGSSYMRKTAYIKLYDNDDKKLLNSKKSDGTKRYPPELADTNNLPSYYIVDNRNFLNETGDSIDNTDRSFDYYGYYFYQDCDKDGKNCKWKPKKTNTGNDADEWNRLGFLNYYGIFDHTTAPIIYKNENLDVNKYEENNLYKYNVVINNKNIINDKYKAAYFITTRLGYFISSMFLYQQWDKKNIYDTLNVLPTPQIRTSKYQGKKFYTFGDFEDEKKIQKRIRYPNCDYKDINTSYFMYNTITDQTKPLMVSNTMNIFDVKYDTKNVGKHLKDWKSVQLDGVSHYSRNANYILLAPISKLANANNLSVGDTQYLNNNNNIYTQYNLYNTKNQFDPDGILKQPQYYDNTYGVGGIFNFINGTTTMSFLQDKKNQSSLVSAFGLIGEEGTTYEYDWYKFLPSLNLTTGSPDKPFDPNKQIKLDAEFDTFGVIPLQKTGTHWIAKITYDDPLDQDLAPRYYQHYNINTDDMINKPFIESEIEPIKTNILWDYNFVAFSINNSYRNWIDGITLQSNHYTIDNQWIDKNTRYLSFKDVFVKNYKNKTERFFGDWIWTYINIKDKTIKYDEKDIEIAFLNDSVNQLKIVYQLQSGHPLTIDTANLFHERKFKEGHYFDIEYYPAYVNFAWSSTEMYYNLIVGNKNNYHWNESVRVDQVSSATSGFIQTHLGVLEAQKKKADMEAAAAKTEGHLAGHRPYSGGGFFGWLMSHTNLESSTMSSLGEQLGQQRANVAEQQKKIIDQQIAASASMPPDVNVSNGKMANAWVQKGRYETKFTIEAYKPPNIITKAIVDYHKRFGYEMKYIVKPDPNTQYYYTRYNYDFFQTKDIEQQLPATLDYNINVINLFAHELNNGVRIFHRKETMGRLDVDNRERYYYGTKYRKNQQNPNMPYGVLYEDI